MLNLTMVVNVNPGAKRISKMPEKYADMLTHCGVPIATIVANGGKRRVTLDWSKLVFPLVVAIIMGFGGAAYNQAGLNGKVTATLDNVANALA